MPAPSIPILIGEVRSKDAPKLPPLSKNVFSRLIGKSSSPRRPPDELRCTQMLCSVLEHSPTFRLALLKEHFELTFDPNMECDVRSEAPAGERKRIDIVLEIISPPKSAIGEDNANDNAGDAGRHIVIAIEVKVGASFHGRTDQNGRDEHQLKPYDDWLNEQRTKGAKHIGAAVVSMARLDLPTPHSHWKNLIWEQLGTTADECLRQSHLPEVERFILSHFRGFTLKHLKGNDGTIMEKLNFNDIALLRALGQSGKQFRNKILDLGSEFSAILESTQVGVGDANTKEDIYENWPFGTCTTRGLFKAQKRFGTSARVSVCITGNPGYPSPVLEIGVNLMPLPDTFEKFKKLGNASTVALNDILPGWKSEGFESPEIEDEDCSIYLSKSLTEFLDAADPKAEINATVTLALNAIKATNLVEEFRSLVDQK